MTAVPRPRSWRRDHATCVVARADSEGLPCYLETSKERNLVFYRKHGFDVVHEGTMPGGGPRFWTMSRAARQPEGQRPAG